MTRPVPLAALLVLALVAGCRTHTPTQPATPAAAPVSVKAGDLLKDYGGNALAADKKYKGQVLRVTGKFGSVQKAPLIGYTLQLLPEDAGDISLSAVQCVLEESAQSAAAELKEGQTVTIQGTCDGQVVGQVKLSHCTVVK